MASSLVLAARDVLVSHDTFSLGHPSAVAMGLVAQYRVPVGSLCAAGPPGPSSTSKGRSARSAGHAAPARTGGFPETLVQRAARSRAAEEPGRWKLCFAP